MLLRSRIIHHEFKRNYCFKSALYITGDKAQHIFVPIASHVDFNVNRDKLQENFSRRNLDFNIYKLEKRMNFYRFINEKKTILQETRDEINNLYLQLIREKEDLKTDEINRLKLHKHVVSEELKSLKEYLYRIEETVMVSLLNLPNELHELTPTKNDKIIHENQAKPVHESENHIVIGQRKNLIKLIGNWGCYLKCEAAVFELAISNYFVESLINAGLVQFSNADFSRSVVVEGCGTNVVNNEKVLTIFEQSTKNEEFEELSRLHVTGSSSLYAFMAYFSKHSVQKSHFPLRYFCCGRSYNGNLRGNNNMFDLNQNSTLNIFIATLDDDNHSSFNESVEIVRKIYDNLDYHYRFVYLEPSKLNKNESLRLSIQMYSNSSRDYVEVGNLSHYASYISKRLFFTCPDGSQAIFPQIISGDVLNVQKMLACIIENYNGETIVNDFLKQYL